MHDYLLQNHEETLKILFSALEQFKILVLHLFLLSTGERYIGFVETFSKQSFGNNSYIQYQVPESSERCLSIHPFAYVFVISIQQMAKIKISTSMFDKNKTRLLRDAPTAQPNLGRALFSRPKYGSFTVNFNICSNKKNVLWAEKKKTRYAHPILQNIR